MRSQRLALLGLLVLLTAACGSSGGSSGPVTAPSAPTAPSGSAAQPATVNVGAGTMPIAWAGPESHDATSGTMTWTLSQSGSQVTGDAAINDPVEGSHHGPFAGTVSGNVLSFNFSYGMGGTGCGNAISGTATVGTSSITGTFSGHDCAGQALTNGMVTLAGPPAPYSTTRLPVTGTWKGDLPGLFGGGTSTWVLSQDGDVNGGNVSGSVTVTSNNTLKLGTGSVTGTVTNTFPGASIAATITVNVTFGGACPSMMTLPTAYNGADGQMLTVGYRLLGYSAVSCNGPITPTGFNILRQ
jgi:hypothetical protein